MQKLLGSLLAVIAVLLGVIIYLLVRPSVGGLEPANSVDAVAAGDNATAAAAAPDAGDGVNPIDAIVENVISTEGVDAAGPPAVKIASIPRQFWGVWTQRPELCGRASEDDSAMDVTPKAMRFWESSGDVRSVTVTNPMTIEVAAAFSGEGQTWEATSRLSLAGSRKELLVSDPDGRGTWYKKCPDEKAAAPGRVTAP